MNNKKIRLTIIAIIILIFVIILFRYVFYNRYKIPNGAEIEISNEEILVYSEDLKLNDLIKTSNVKIINENLEINTNNIGEQKATIEYKYKGIRKYKYDVTYTVIDSTAPIFITSPASSITFYVDEASKDDIEKALSKATYADNYDIYPKLSVTGEIDFSKVGTYTLTCTLSDSSNNTTDTKINVRIIERPVNTNNEEITTTEEDEDDKISFDEHIENYKTENTMVGIDISKWQGEVDFEKIKDAGCEFVIMRIGVMKDKDSELVKDEYFDANYKNAKEVGLKVGIYVYSEANNVETAISNAEFVIDNLKGEKLVFPVVFDWESWTYFNDMEMNLHMLNEMYDAFSNKLKEAGYDSMLYASEYYLNNVWLDLKDYTIWVAKYSINLPKITNGNNKYILWQNACTGQIDGIENDVDLDVFYK